MKAYSHYRDLNTEQTKLLKEKLEIELKMSELVESGKSTIPGSGKAVSDLKEFLHLDGGLKDKTDNKTKEFSDLELRLKTIDTSLNWVDFQFADFRKDYLSGGPLTLSAKQAGNASLSTFCARMDLAMLIAADTDLRKPEELEKVHLCIIRTEAENCATGTKNGLRRAALHDLNLHLNTLPECLKSNATINAANEKFREYSVVEGFNLSRLALEELSKTPSYKEYSRESEAYIRMFRNLPIEALEDIGLNVSRSSKIFDPSIDLNYYLSLKRK